MELEKKIQLQQNIFLGRFEKKLKRFFCTLKKKSHHKSTLMKNKKK